MLPMVGGDVRSPALQSFSTHQLVQRHSDAGRDKSTAWRGTLHRRDFMVSQPLPNTLAVVIPPPAIRAPGCAGRAQQVPP